MITSWDPVTINELVEALSKSSKSPISKWWYPGADTKIFRKNIAKANLAVFIIG